MAIALIVIAILVLLALLLVVVLRQQQPITFENGDFATTSTLGLNLTNPRIHFQLSTTANSGVVLFFPPPPVSTSAFSTVLMTVTRDGLNTEIVSYPVAGGFSEDPTTRNFMTAHKINDGAFHAITLLLTPTNLTLFIDGVVAENASINPYAPIQSSQVLFGGYPNVTHGLKGSIRNVNFDSVDKTLVLVK